MDIITVILGAIFTIIVGFGLFQKGRADSTARENKKLKSDVAHVQKQSDIYKENAEGSKETAEKLEQVESEQLEQEEDIQDADDEELVDIYNSIVDDFNRQ